MKIAIPVISKTKDSIMAERFGRAPYYAIYNEENNEFEFLENPATQARGGAGIQAVEFLISKNVQAVIVPEVGPKAERVLRSSNIIIHQGLKIQINELISKWKNEELKII